MEVLYDDKNLEKVCTDQRAMRKERVDIAKKLPLRIKALETTTNVGELATHDPLGKWHPLNANLNGLWAGKLSANWRLLVRPEDSEDGRDAVVVTVVEISNHYDH